MAGRNQFHEGASREIVTDQECRLQDHTIQRSDVDTVARHPPLMRNVCIYDDVLRAIEPDQPSALEPVARSGVG